VSNTSQKLEDSKLECNNGNGIYVSTCQICQHILYFNF